ncbi:MULTISPECIES: SixA phosphatase family protein [Streptomyces]|uniref:Histidine phosphatase family protein n=1 Tax=Streptomyces chengmaiensis TaxID=3040919 RepID=A0ABT6HNY7_9ACTN|nr:MULTISPECIES: histidine phosphatase family protein [Streptomyces]MDH2390413.1 histidine phosphatase family protein [Streptomyces chengmaiensis]WRQ78753.1 histidine phosphatase family protein [Streptomyces sp. MUM 178J]
MSVAELRRIVLFRHAKADWPQVTDHERPLAERGRKDAPVAGRKLADTGIAFDLALCSTATRTRETWKLAVQEFPRRPKTVYEERVYEASPGELIAVLNETPDDMQNVLLIGHNPGVQGLADILSAESEGDAGDRMARRGFPTSAFAVISFSGTWKTLEPGVGTLVDYWAPSK